MTALVLVVDDVPANVKLLEAKLTGEYYDVITARDGHECLEKAKKQKPDLILLDVMMPGIDGFETCKLIKEDAEISHIPVVMVTALSDKADRLRGLEAGADDFLTKPINDTALIARVKSLVRIKVLLDELRLRDQTGAQMGVRNDAGKSFTSDVSGASILVVDDDIVQLKRVTDALAGAYKVTAVNAPETAQATPEIGNYDLILISTQLSEMDGLRLASHFKSQEDTRHIPILIMVDEDDKRAMLKGLEMGINDYLMMPVDLSEMTARVKTQIRRKKYQEALKANYQQSISMAITDALTGLYNRHYLNTHLENTVRNALANSKPLSLMIMDMDHFKSVNDTYGHDVGDQVLKQLADIIVKTTRSADLVARFGGEEFVVLMPETDEKEARDAAERLRKRVESTPFIITHEVGQITKTLSIGVSYLDFMGDSCEALLKRADEALYRAKNGGRNRVEMAG